MAATSSIRTGLIGYGFAGRAFHAPLIRATPGYDLVAVGSSNAAKVHADLPMVDVADPATVIGRDDLDLIVIATPNDTHAPLALTALSAGRHVVIDKPFAIDIAEARALIERATCKSRILSVFHNRRWDGDFLSVRAAIDDSTIGPPVLFESHFDRFRPQIRDRWRERAGAGGGIWYDLGPHMVDQSLMLFGLPGHVTADLAALRKGAVVDDWAHATLHYPGRRVIVNASMLTAGGAARFTVHGPGGTLVKLRIDPQEAQLLAGVVPGDPGWGLDDDPLTHIDGEGETTRLNTVPGDQRNFYAGVRDAIRGVAANPVPPVQALAVMAVIEAGLVSAREGRSVALPLTDAERRAYADSRSPA